MCTKMQQSLTISKLCCIIGFVGIARHCKTGSAHRALHVLRLALCHDVVVVQD